MITRRIKLLLLIVLVMVAGVGVRTALAIRAMHKDVAKRTQLAREADDILERYSKALVDRRFEDAYNVDRDEGKQASKLNAFIREQRELESQFGPLLAVEGHLVTLCTPKTAAQPLAYVDGRFKYQSGIVRVACKMHYDSGRWRSFECAPGGPALRDCPLP